MTNPPAIFGRRSAALALAVRFASRLWRNLRNDSRMGLRNILRQRRRSVVALLAIGLGEVAMILAGGFIEWNLWFGRESTIHSQLGHIRAFRPGYLELGAADPHSYLLPEGAPELSAIESTQHVALVAPRLQFNGLVSHADATVSFLGEGVDPSKERTLSRSLEIVQGENLSSPSESAVIVGEGLAANLGLRVGDRVVLLSNTASGGVNAVEATVRGLFATISKEYDDVALRAPLGLARKLIRQAGAHSWLILLDDTRYTQSLVGQFRSRFAAQAYQFATWWDLSDFYRKVEALYVRQFGVVKAIIALIIVLTIVNTLTISVLERTREIGTAMALGRTRSDILRLFVVEGTALGLVGALAGAVLGVVAALAVSAIGIPMPPSPGMAHGFVAEILVTPGLVLQASAIVALAAAFASLYPAWRASRLRIVDALRQAR